MEIIAYLAIIVIVSDLSFPLTLAARLLPAPPIDIPVYPLLRDRHNHAKPQYFVALLYTVTGLFIAVHPYSTDIYKYLTDVITSPIHTSILLYFSHTETVMHSDKDRSIYLSI